MSDVVIPEVFAIFEKKVATLVSYDRKTERARWDEAVIDLLKFFESIIARCVETESQLAEAKTRLAGYEEGYDPKVQMPEFVDGYGWVLARMCEGQNPSMYHYSKFADTWSDVNYNSYPTSKIYCWFPLPGSKEDE